MDQIPHYFSDGRSFHVSTAPGVLAVNPALRASLEAAPNAGAATLQLGTQLPALLLQQTQTAPFVNMRVRWDRLLVTQSYYPNENWELYFRGQNQRRNGTRPRTTGTFARQNFPPINDALWEAMGVELPEPVDYRTTDLTFGIRYARPKWRVGLDYNLTLFRNSIQTLRWENPFRVTDALAVSPAFGVGRNRFAQAQLALPWTKMRFLLEYRANDIDNQSQQIQFPGLPSFGDSTVRTAVDFYNLPIENFPTSYTRQNTTAAWEWDPLPNLSWKLDYDWEIWNRRFLRVPTTNEHSLRGRVDYRLTRGVLFKSDYLYSHRKPDNYPVQPLVFNPNLNVGTAAAPISGGPI